MYYLDYIVDYNC